MWDLRKLDLFTTHFEAVAKTLRINFVFTDVLWELENAGFFYGREILKTLSSRMLKLDFMFQISIGLKLHVKADFLKINVLVKFCFYKHFLF